MSAAPSAPCPLAVARLSNTSSVPNHPVPGFPTVKCHWEGFCLTHRKTVGWPKKMLEESTQEASNDPGFKQTAEAVKNSRFEYRQQTKRPPQGWFYLPPLAERYRRQRNHETIHYRNAHTGLAAVLTCRVAFLDEAILALGRTLPGDPDPPRHPLNPEKHPDLITVPLTHAEPDTLLYREWQRTQEVLDLFRPLDEVLAVYGELTTERDEEGGLSLVEYREEAERLCAAYEGSIRDFTSLYKEVETLVERIGKPQALKLATGALHTAYPVMVFKELKKEVVKSFLIYGPDAAPRVMRQQLDLPVDNPGSPFYPHHKHWLDPTEVVRRFPSWVGEALPDPGHYEYWGFDDKGLYLPDPGLVFVITKATSPAPTPQRVFMHSNDLDQSPHFTEEEKRRLKAQLNDRIDARTRAWVESLLQQLVEGIGLQCAFWREGWPCCDEYDEFGRRQILEGIWQHTRHKDGPGATSWQRLGCLKQPVGESGQVGRG